MVSERMLNIIRNEGLGLFAYKLETLHPDLESASMEDLLVTVIGETERLKTNRHWANPQQVSAATECHRLAFEFIDNLSATEEVKYRRLLVIGYLYGQLTVPGREVSSELHSRERSLFAQTLGFQTIKSEREKAHLLMRTIAHIIWEKDEENRLRTGYVARKVKERLEELQNSFINNGSEGAKHWPLSDKVIRRQIKDIAPEYAKKRGAPKKTNNN